MLPPPLNVVREILYEHGWIPSGLVINGQEEWVKDIYHYQIPTSENHPDYKLIVLFVIASLYLDARKNV